ncbi:putative LPS assembly protein LptD [Pontibacter ummariensis]|uniref:putative LPS assembly protein LptD n=1 Tax=Pontibacter ummariensis TaxID=1610492 RepID=UPI000D05B760|nr:putative LPS assembly protein LptD [Pontibacter ummariensis]
MRHIFIFLLLLQIVVFSPLLATGQGFSRAPGTAQDTAAAAPDSITLAAPKGDIETTIKYSAKDSIQFEVDRKVVHLYGDAKINYGTMSLEAAYIEIDYDKNTLTAASRTDSTGKEIGVPVFADGGQNYAAKNIAYNYKTKRGRISEVVTQQGEGFIHSAIVKRNEENEFFGLHNKYTTCNLEHPHFYINADRIKAIPNDKVLSGPFNLVIGDIPLPVGFLFGLFPTPMSKRASGIKVPSFGENSRGFYLNDIGYYFAWNDYMGTLIQGDIYSLGGYNIDASTDYVKRYAYRGRLGLTYDYFKNDEADVARARSTESGFELPPSRRTFWINWSHTPVRKPGRGTFSASVNAGSQLHQRLNYTNSANYLSPTFNSNVTYQKTIPNSPFSYTLKASQAQSTQTGVMNFVLPDLNFSMTTVSLYELFSDAPSTGKWYENFTVGYNLRARNEISNLVSARRLSGVNIIGETTGDTLALNLDNLQELWENGRRTADHNFSIGLGNYKLFRYFNFTPGVNYSEAWYDEKFSYSFNPDSQRVDVDTTNFGRVYQYSASASLNTTIYGTMYFKGKKIEAIRHLMRPSISYSYRPDFGDARFGLYQDVLTGIDLENRPIYQRLGRFRTGLPGTGLSSSLNFSIDNNLEMKVRSKADSAENKFEKISLIDNLRISSGYNFAAESFKLAPIRLSMNTQLFKIVGVTFSSTFDPYKVDAEGKRIDEYMFDFSKLKVARLTNANLNLRTSLNPEARRTENSLPSNLPDLGPDLDPLLPEYVDFKIPWTLSLDYTMYYTRGEGLQPDRFDNTFGINGSLSLTEKWKLTYNGTYNVTANNISYASINIYRDLHCWDMSIGWIPFGFQRGYNITINARSALLRDLRLTRNRSGFNRY